ncbi:MAG: hypothetical protein U0930_24160 [Pirellulales bacterium]
MFAIDVASRLIHVLTGIMLLGGSLFSLLVLVPTLEAAEGEAKAKLVDAIRNRWKRFVHAGIALFLVSGFYNYFVAMPNHKGDGLYHALIGTKIILALGLFFIASALVGRSAAFEGFRKNSNKWLKIVCLIGIVIVGMSSFLKVRGTKPVLVQTPNGQSPAAQTPVESDTKE